MDDDTRMQGDWNRIKAEVKEQWNQLTDGEIEGIDGRRNRLLGALQTSYGLDQREAERQVSIFESTRDL